MTTRKNNAGQSARPQNNGYPAGGSNPLLRGEIGHGDRGQRGVVVAPPSGNTRSRYTVLHRGFDTFALSVKANIPRELADVLDVEKERAEVDGEDALVRYEGNVFHLKSHGGAGYRYILSGGPDGATWFFKRPNPRDPWGIRVSFGSYFLAMNGLGRAKAHLEQWLEAFGVRHGPNDISISRADFCVDILAPEFSLNPDQFVMHSSTGRRDHLTTDDLVVHGKSGRVTSVTVGSSRNRQAILYDKRAEVIAHSKGYWWDIWNHTLRMGGESEKPIYTLRREGSGQTSEPPPSIGPLSADPSAADHNRVWRVEMRAGKDLLKDRWGIRTWSEFFDRYGDLCREAFSVIRYAEPTAGDTNRARWDAHPLWRVALAEAEQDLWEMRSGADPNPMKQVHKFEHIGKIIKSLTGNAIAVAALNGYEVSDLPDVFHGLADDMADIVSVDPEKAAKKLQAAKDRYVFLDSSE